MKFVSTSRTGINLYIFRGWCCRESSGGPWALSGIDYHEISIIISIGKSEENAAENANGGNVTSRFQMGEKNFGVTTNVVRMGLVKRRYKNRVFNEIPALFHLVDDV